MLDESVEGVIVLGVDDVDDVFSDLVTSGDVEAVSGVEENQVEDRGGVRILILTDEDEPGLDIMSLKLRNFIVVLIPDIIIVVVGRRKRSGRKRSNLTETIVVGVVVVETCSRSAVGVVVGDRNGGVALSNVTLGVGVAESLSSAELVGSGAMENLVENGIEVEVGASASGAT